MGLIGCGAIGAWHARVLSEHSGVLFAGICDVDPAKVTSLSEALEVAGYHDPDRFFAECDLDGVIIATPDSVHLDNVALAASHQVACLVEKPVAQTVGAIETIAAIAQEAGIMVMAGHIERFEAGTAQLKTALDEGVCGRVISVMARRQFAPGEAPRFAGHASTLRVLGVHDFDLLRWVHPGAVDQVYAAAGRGALFDRHGLDDHVVTTVSFSDGAIGAVESAWNLPLAYAAFETPRTWGPAGNNRLDVFGDFGFLSNDMSLRNQQLIAFDSAQGYRAAGIRHQPIIHGRVEGALRLEVEHFVACVAAGRPPMVGLSDALRAVALTEAAEESLAAGRPVRPYC